MIPRPSYLSQLKDALRRSPVTALLGPRQVGKTTLAGQVIKGKDIPVFDLGSFSTRKQLEQPELFLGGLQGLVVLDEIQIMPELFSVLRVLVDRNKSSRYLIMGSASPDILRKTSETLAGRIEFIELSPFDATEVSPVEKLWLRGGFPLSFLASDDEDSWAWRRSFTRTFLERDIPQLGIRIPPLSLSRAWVMLAHYHGQVFNSSEISRSLGVSHNTVRNYLDLLTGAFIFRQLPPWHENLGKRQVKSPKLYVRDSGLLHFLLGIEDRQQLFANPRLGASWEGFVIEQILRVLQPYRSYFWASHQGAELDLFLPMGKSRFGVEVKFSEGPSVTPSMRIALKDLHLDHLWVVYPGKTPYPLDRKITVVPLKAIISLAKNKFEQQLSLPFTNKSAKKKRRRSS